MKFISQAEARRHFERELIGMNCPRMRMLKESCAALRHIDATESAHKDVRGRPR